MEKKAPNTTQNIDKADFSMLLNSLKELRDEYRIDTMKLSNKKLPAGERERIEKKRISIEQQIEHLKQSYKNAPLPDRDYYAEPQNVPTFVDSWIETIMKS